jgi:drug/metabolite transporter (DMT)-like permease
VNHSAPGLSDYRAPALAVWTALSAVYLIWGSTYLAIRFTVETTPPFLSAAARFIVSGAFLYLWRRAAGDPAPTPEERRNAVVIGIFLLVGGNGGVVWAAQYIPSSLSALLVATVPLWMILFDALRHGEKPGRAALGGISVGFCGAALLIGWSGDSTSVEHLHGAVAVLGASCLWAIGSIYGKSAKLPASPLVTTGIEMLAGGILQILVAYFFGEFERFDFNTVSRRSALAWTYLTVIGPAAFVAYAWLLRVAPIPLVATYSYVNPLVAIVLGYFLGKEIIAPRTFLAAALIIGSVVLVSAPKRSTI